MLTTFGRLCEHRFMDRLFPLIEPIAQDLGWNPGDDRIGRHVLGHNSTGADNGAVPNRDPAQKNRSMADQHISADRRGTGRRPAGKNNRYTRLIEIMV